MQALLRSCARTCLDFLLPPTCGVCRRVVDGAGALCATCWARLSFIEAPFCACCGVPFSVPLSSGAMCAACLTEAPPFGRARAALVYDKVSRRLIGRFKYRDQTFLLPTLLPWLQRAGRDLREGVDLVLPVPMHRWRLWRRTYNQAALLARALGAAWGKPVALHTLVRTHATRPQVGLTAEARAQNVARAFAVKQGITKGGNPVIKDKVILLVDDVFTTGATLRACTGVLLAGGARDVRVLTLARVIQPETFS